MSLLPYKRLSHAILAGAAALQLACGKEDGGGVDVTAPLSDASTWSQVQGILSANCVGCHTAGTSQARQSDLVLTPDAAYDQLIDRPPKNAAAQEDGLVRVSSQGVPGLTKSFLWEKINAPSADHFYDDHPGYGTLMPPPPGQPLTYGELEFIRKWIIEGAPRTGQVADPALLDNEERHVYGADPFAAAAPPANGTQLHLGPFEVFPDNEREFFYYQPLGNDEPVYLQRVEIDMRRGSHHFILYGFEEGTPGALLPEPGVFRDLRDRDGQPIVENYLTLGFLQFIAGTQWPRYDYRMPEGVALEIPAHYAFDMNSHYVNRTGESYTGEVYVNLHYADPAAIDHIAQVIDFSNEDIHLPPGKTTTLERVFRFSERVQVFQLFSHAHELNTEFKVQIVGGDRDGQEVYYSDDWEHPPIAEYDPPLTLQRGEGFRLVATYDNWRDEAVEFGLLSTDEMMILFGLYYTD